MIFIVIHISSHIDTQDSDGKMSTLVAIENLTLLRSVSSSEPAGEPLLLTGGITIVAEKLHHLLLTKSG